MRTRRGVLTTLGMTVFAGCSSQTSNEPSGNTTTNETREPETQPVNDEVEVDDPHLDWAYGEDQQILEQVQDEVNLDPVKNILEEDQGTHRKIGDALLQANTQYDHSNGGYEHRHKTAVTAVTQAIQDLNLDIQLTTIADWAKTNEYPSEGLDYSKVWVNDSEKDINVALNPEMRSPAYHIEGEEETNGDIERILKEINDQDYTGDLSAHDLPTLQDSQESYEARRADVEYTDQEIEEWNGSWIEIFDNYIWGEGTPVPSSVEDWRAMHQGFESGPELIRELNRAYRDAGYNGETAQFTVEDGSVSMSDVPDDYNPSEDGVPGNPAA